MAADLHLKKRELSHSYKGPYKLNQDQRTFTVQRLWSGLKLADRIPIYFQAISSPDFSINNEKP